MVAFMNIKVTFASFTLKSLLQKVLHFKILYLIILLKPLKNFIFHIISSY